MQGARYHLRFAIYAFSMLLWACPTVRAEATNSSTYPIDLPTALQLAGARNLDVQIARARLSEARANQAGAVAGFLPWLSPGVSYQQHDEFTQDVAGNIVDVHKYAYAPGGTVAARVDLGDAWFRALATRQLTKAAGQALEAQRQDSVAAAAIGYFELVARGVEVRIAAESVRISLDYENELEHAVAAGIAFKGDQLRVQVELERNRIAWRAAVERQRVASARLAEALHLDPLAELAARDTDLMPLTLVETNAALSSLVQRGLAARPELKQNDFLLGAARDARSGAAYGPLIPAVAGQAFFGGLGGGRRGIADTFGQQQDYFAGIGWRIGPGGLFDFTRIHAEDARLKAAELNREKLQDAISREVVEAYAHWQSVSDQMTTAQSGLAAAEEGLKLARARQEFAVGIVLENIQAEQDLTQARLDYATAVAELNKAQYALLKATGGL